MKTVRLSGLNDHTFVFFTSDNGWVYIIYIMHKRSMWDQHWQIWYWVYDHNNMFICSIQSHILLIIKTAVQFINLFWHFSPDLSLKKRDREGSSGILRCGKGSTWEGGMRVPAIAWWRRMVIKGFSHQLSSIIDILPTIFKMAGVKASENITLDGYDMTKFLYHRAGRVRRETFE